MGKKIGEEKKKGRRREEEGKKKGRRREERSPRNYFHASRGEKNKQEVRSSKEDVKTK